MQLPVNFPLMIPLLSGTHSHPAWLPKKLAYNSPQSLEEEQGHGLDWFLFLFKPLFSSRDLGTVCLLLQLETLTEVWSEEFSLVAQPEHSLTERDSMFTKALKYRQA